MSLDAMLTALAVIAGVSAASIIASYLLWWASHRSGLWNFAAGILLGLAIVLAAILVGYLMARGTYPE